MFQSLVGFKINWNADLRSGGRPILKFQSLVGFKINWNLNACNQDIARVLSFNP
ncbi:hypothetical protein BFG60_3043 [Microcystis aeruginosa NIES-98]|nr:hypothetical protein BFG60_3043 [Microcystis aeruginosa NIES-98]